MITVAVCDDSMAMVKSMKENLEEYGKENNHELRIFNFVSGEELLENYSCKYDILFLDIKMIGMNGIQVAEKIRERDQNVVIIFLTSLVQYALDGYKVNAASYILKPIKKARLKIEMDQVIEKIAQRDDPFITVHNDCGNYKILLKSISYIETYNRNLLIHTNHGNVLCYWKMKEMEKRVEKYGFARCHSSFLVNLLFVENIQKNDLKLASGELIPIGKSKKKNFMLQLSGFWGERI